MSLKAIIKKLLPKGVFDIAAMFYKDKNGKIRPSLTVNGVKFYRPLLAGIAANGQVYINEIWMAELIERLPLRGTTFVDVGVNVGQTLLSIKSVYRDACYYGFEPNPSCIFYVERLVEKNNISNVHLIPAGLSDDQRIARLWVSMHFPMSSGSTMKETKFKNPHFISTCRLDDIWEEISGGPISLLKVDVEGHEPEVFKGALKVIDKYRPIITTELLPLRMDDDVARRSIRDELQNVVNRMNYKIFRIVTSEESGFVGITELQSFSTKVTPKEEEKFRRDYLLMPLERVKEIAALLVVED